MKKIFSQLKTLMIHNCRKQANMRSQASEYKFRNQSVGMSFCTPFGVIKSFVGFFSVALTIFLGTSEFSSTATQASEIADNSVQTSIAREQLLIPIQPVKQHIDFNSPVNNLRLATIDPGGTITDGVVDGTDLPRISVSSDDEQITEGGKITFTISSNIAPSTDLSVNLGLVIPLYIPIPSYLTQYPVIAVDYGLGERGLSVPAVTIKAGTNSEIFEVQTTNDPTAIGDFELAIEVLSATGNNKYLISTTRNSYSDKVVIIDDEITMSIRATSTTANQNSDANFEPSIFFSPKN